MDKEWLETNFKYFGYGAYYHPDETIAKKNAEQLIPSVPLSFYSFHIMVILGMYFIVLFALIGFVMHKNVLTKQRWLLWIMVWSMPLGYIASESGWILAEVGRQPWVIQDLMPTITAVTKIDATSVQTTFWLFAAIFTALLIAEIRIMVTAIKDGRITSYNVCYTKLLRLITLLNNNRTK